MPSRNPSCRYCALHKDATTVCVDGSGPDRADIMIVGEAPGENEDREGVPFIGDSGVLLDRLLNHVGLRRDQVRVTNSVRCRPPANRTPLVDEQKACLGYLLEEISQVQPKVVIAMGGAALKALVGRESVGKERGQLLHAKPGIRMGDAAIIATYHPSYYLHSHDKTILQNIADDLSLAQRMVTPKVAQDDPVSLLLPGYTTQELRAALGTLTGARMATCDLEWRGIEKQGMYWPWRATAEPYSISLTARIDGVLTSVGISLPLPDAEAHVALQEFFTACPIIGHNIQSDLIWLTALGFVIRLAGDTMLLAQLLDEGRSLTLESLATTVAGVDIGWKAPLWAAAPRNETEWRQLFSHNIGDVQATHRLAEKLHEQLRERPAVERERVVTYYKNLSLPSIPMFVDVAINGTRLDGEMLDRTIAESRATSARLAAEFADLIKNSSEQAPSLSPVEAAEIATSTQKTVRVLQEVFQLPVLSSAASVLDEYADRPEIKLVQDIRHEQKTRGTYLTPWRKLTDECGGRIHSVYRLAGARTGRTSAELEYGGSIQVAPREDRIRMLLTVDEGNVLVAGDYSQMELRVAAWFANERAMLNLYQQGADIHLNTAMGVDKATTLRTAASILGSEPASYDQAANLLLATPDLVRRFPEWKELRQQAKGVNFGFCLHPDTLVLMADLSWTKLSDVKVGDKIVGFNETSIPGRGSRALVATDVLATFERSAKCYRITTEDGEVLATADHPWLADHPHGETYKWMTTSELKPGHKIAFTFSPQTCDQNQDYRDGYLLGIYSGDGRKSRAGLVFEKPDREVTERCEQYLTDCVVKTKFHPAGTLAQVDMFGISCPSWVAPEFSTESDDFTAGFLAGFLDTDGYSGYVGVQWTNTKHHFIDQIEQALTKLGFLYRTWQDARDGCFTVGLLGGQRERMRLLSRIHPAATRKIVYSRSAMKRSTIISIEPLGEQTVLDLKTSTATFIANGFASHNCYGMGWEKFIIYARSSYNVLFTPEEAQDARNAFFALYPGLLPWHARCEAEWQRDGYTVTPLGRYRRHVEDGRQAINTPVQSTASDLTILAMIEVDKEIKRKHLPAKLIGFVHDSIMVEARKDIAPEIKEILIRCMENPPIERFGIRDVPVPFKADVKIGDRWATAS